MPNPLHSLTLLSLSPCIALCLGYDTQRLGLSMYGDHSLAQPAVGATVTATLMSTVTVGQTFCNTVYIPTTITLHAECTSASNNATTSGLPISNQTGLGPWLNATSTDAPCTHDLPTSSLLTAPGNFSRSLSWDRTTATSRWTLTETAVTSIETAEPIGTTPAPWRNSTRISTTAEDSTSFITVTLLSSTVATVNATVSSGRSGPTASSSGYSVGTGSPRNNTTNAPSTYQPSLTYHTTVPRSSGSATHSTIRNGTTSKASASAHTSARSLPPGWSVSTVSVSAKPSLSTPSSSSSAPSFIPTSPSNTTFSILTTATEDPLFTTRSGQTSQINVTFPSIHPSNSTLQTATLTPSSTTAGDDNSGDQYGSYTYSAPAPPHTTTTASLPTSASGTDVASVDPIQGTKTSTGRTQPPTTLTTVSKSTGSASGGVAETESGSGTTVMSSTSKLPEWGYGYGYGGGYGY